MKSTKLIALAALAAGCFLAGCVKKPTQPQPNYNATIQNSDDAQHNLDHEMQAQ